MRGVAVPPSGEAARRAVGRRQRWELAGGVAGFFTVVALVNAVGLIATGRPSVLASLLLLTLLVASWLAYRGWRRADRAVKAC